jgi:FtsP/CotA-like multicopper oxidase with cupredoxin domain
MSGPSRRELLLGAAALGGSLLLPGCGGKGGGRGGAAEGGKGVVKRPDFTLRIAPATIEVAPGKEVRTVAYNGSVPGPLLRWREGVPVAIEVHNETERAEWVHWHGQIVQAAVDGAREEATPVVPARGAVRYDFVPQPAGTRWYHTQTAAGTVLTQGAYSGQFGFFYVEPKHEAGRYDREVFLATHEFEPSFIDRRQAPADPDDAAPEHSPALPTGSPPAPPAGASASPPPPAGTENGQGVGYRWFTINGRMLGHGEPIRVRQGERVMFRIVNASATEVAHLALPGHRFEVVALDGNPVPTPATVDVLRLGTGERIDAVVEMNRPGVWVLGATGDAARAAGCGVVVEYAGSSGAPRWVAPPRQPWNYAWFGASTRQMPPDEHIRMTFARIAGGRGGYDRWTINGKPFPQNGPFYFSEGRHYRLVLRNDSDEAHSVHLHRHPFELTRVHDRATAGVVKDTVQVDPGSTVEVDLIALNPGPTLLHCQHQLHMDFGFMALFHYV